MLRFFTLSLFASVLSAQLLPAQDSLDNRAFHHIARPGALVPDWAKDVVWYQIFPERFRNGDPSNDPTRETLESPEAVPQSWTLTPWTSDWYDRAPWEQELGENFYHNGSFDRRYGGDLQGVLDKLDYLVDLGITAIYFNPIFYATSMHKYNASSLHHIDPYFGPDPAGDLIQIAEETEDPASWTWTSADSLFLQILQEAKARNIRVIIDGVFNHTGIHFFAFEDLVANQEASRYKDWYIVESFDDPETPANEFSYQAWWNYSALPEFANTPDSLDLAPGPKAYVMDITRRWMDPNGDGDPSDGVDGWRLDVTPDVPSAFWNEWNHYVRYLNPEAYTVSEVWFPAAELVREGSYSANMNYDAFAFPARGFFFGADALDWSARDFFAHMKSKRAEYDPETNYVQQNLFDSHDTERMASQIVNNSTEGATTNPGGKREYQVRKPNAEDRKKQRIASLFQMCYVGAPILYYGTESGMWGAHDPDDRMPMNWPDLEFEVQDSHPFGASRSADDVSFDSTLFAYYQHVIALRHRYEALRRGGIQFVKENGAAFSFTRTYGDSTILITINRSTTPITLSFSPVQAAAQTPVFFTDGPLEGLDYEALPNGGFSLVLPGLSGAVFSME